MKKTLSWVLMLCMLVSVAAPTLVFAEETNLALGKEVLNAKVSGANANYCADMTDGVIADAISTENGVWFGYWYNPDASADVIAEKSNTDENGVAIPTIDLGGSYELSSARIHIVDQADWGICAPTSVVAQISDDGENFKDVVTVTEFTSGVTWVDFDLAGVTAQYVRLAIDLSTSWFFLDEIEIYGAGASGGDVEEPAPEPEELPADAIVLDYAGYVHDSYFEILAGDNMTVGELTALGIGESKDMNYFVVAVVGADGVITEMHTTLGRPDGVKTDVVCPEGGYLIGLNGNKAGYDVLLSANVGDSIVLYNTDVDSFRGKEGSIALENAGFAIVPAPEVPDVPADPEPENKTYKDTLVEGEDGNYSCEVPYGYTWSINYIDGTIAGEDNTICTTQDAYNACNPNWAITVYAELQEDGTYVALKDAIATPGSAANAGITLGEGQIALVAHSAYSNPNGANWEGKVVAMSVKAGDVLVVDMDAMTVYAVIPGEDVVLPEPPVAEPEEEITANIETVVNEDNTVTVRVSFAGIVSDLNGVSANVLFDAEALTLLNAITEENAVDCFLITPSKEWENLSALVSGENGTYIAIKACVAEGDFASITDGNLVFEFNFQPTAGYKSTWVEVADVEFLDNDLEYHYGNGATVEIALPDLKVPTNIAEGKEVLDATKRPSYNAELTDGVALESLTYNAADWFGYYWNFKSTLEQNQAQNTNAVDGIGKATIDFGGLYDLTSVRVNTFLGNTSGITAPKTITVRVSEDGENYVDVAVKNFEIAASGDATVAWVEFDLPADTKGQYVQVVFELQTTFVFINEIEVYGLEHSDEPVDPEPPVEPEEPTGSESLIPGEGANWINTDNGGASVKVIYNEDGSVTFAGSVSGTWPCVDTWYVETPIIADTLDDYLSIDFTVAGGSTNINFFFDDGNGGSVSFSVSNTALNAACPDAAIDTGSGDLYDGTYKCTISIADLIASVMNLQGKEFPASAIIDGKVKFIGINVYSVNGGTVTVNDLSVVHVSEEEPEPPVDPEPPVVSDGIVIDGVVDENAYDNAVWFDKGVWQTIGETAPILADLDIAYTTLADAENIYLAICVNKGVEFKTALNPDAWDQSGATNFRLWFKGDGMESRTFFDLLWNGEEFAPFLVKTPTDTMTYAATYGDDYIVMEVKIAKETLSISDSYEMMVTYSTPYCGEGDNVGYNAFHMTSFVRGEDGALPSGWSGNTAMYETYYVADVEIGTVAVGDVNGDGKINGADATRLLNYLANVNYEDGTCDVEISDGADVTGDGVVDGRDSIRLLKYLANFDPTTGESGVELG